MAPRLTPVVSRREWMKMLALSAAASGCDKVVVDVTNKSELQDGRISPVSSNADFYKYQCCGRPDYDPETWEMSIQVGGQEIAVLTADLFDMLEPVELEHTLQCIGGNPRNPLINNAVWGGLPLNDVLDALGVTVPEETVDLRFVGVDEYHTSVPVEDLNEVKIWLVWEMNGEPLPYAHGAPCRFLIMGRYGTKNVKWPVVLDFVDGPYFGYWESRGWSNNATYRQNGFILSPVDGTNVAGPEVEIYGTAHAGEDPVTQVEISFDEGVTWTDTEIYYSPGANIWTLWRYVLQGVTGPVVAEIRVTTESGKVTNGTEGTGQAAGYDGGMRIRFEVRS